VDILYRENTEPHLGHIFFVDLCLRTKIDEISDSVYVSQYPSVFFHLDAFTVPVFHL
jgi:hypothetical protein